VSDVDLAAAARLIAEPVRAAILSALLDGRALTAGELAKLAGVGAPATSSHLSQLLDAGFLRRWPQGRHRYYALAGPEIAGALEALAVISPPLPAHTLRASGAANALRPARLCYDHLAGELGVRIYDRLVAIGGLVLDDRGLALNPSGAEWFALSDVRPPDRPTRRALLRPCLDWTERRPHLAGHLAATFATAALDREWVVRRAPGERGLRITELGREHFATVLPA